MRREQPFGGVVGRYDDESSPWWPDPDRTPAGAPNVAIMVLDDVGFAQLGCFGSDLSTPTFDRAGRRGTALHERPHHGLVVPYPLVCAHREEP